MTPIEPDEMRELSPQDVVPNLGQLAVCRPEHCCHEAAVRELTVFERGDGSRVTMWALVAEFIEADEAHRFVARHAKMEQG